jgi:hypothetical protein
MPLRSTPGAEEGACGARGAVCSAVWRVLLGLRTFSLSLAGYPDLRIKRTIALDCLKPTLTSQ